MNEDRLVSVIVCTYNRAELLRKTIRLLQVQDYPKDNYEIIIIDNGSSDNTRSVVNYFLEKHGSNIHYVLESRKGVTFARNRGMEVANFPYLAYIDDDCAVGPNWLQSLMKGYSLDDRIFAVFGQLINDWGDQIKPSWMMPETERLLGNNSFLGNSPRILQSWFGTREGNLSIKKETLMSFGGFLGMEQFGSRDMAAGELKYCLWQANKKGAKFAYIPNAIVKHQVIPRSRIWMLQRAYWQGISDGIYEYIIYKPKWWRSLIRAAYDMAAMVFLFGNVLFFMINHNQSKWMFHLLRAVRRYSLILSELHLKGNWSRVKAWIKRNKLEVMDKDEKK